MAENKNKSKNESKNESKGAGKTGKDREGGRQRERASECAGELSTVSSPKGTNSIMKTSSSDLTASQRPPSHWVLELQSMNCRV
jgi:hypothetical protein